MAAYRDNGAIGALLDEYEKAISELKSVIKNIDSNALKIIVDHKTSDKDCESIQTILTHVVSAGYAYVTMIRNHLGETLPFHEKARLDSSAEYILALDKMFLFNEQLFLDYPNINMETYEESEKIKSRWGQSFDVDQMFEHAIVHILRHRRQIERFLLKIGG